MGHSKGRYILILSLSVSTWYHHQVLPTTDLPRFPQPQTRRQSRVSVQHLAPSLRDRGNQERKLGQKVVGERVELCCCELLRRRPAGTPLTGLAARGLSLANQKLRREAKGAEAQSQPVGLPWAYCDTAYIVQCYQCTSVPGRKRRSREGHLTCLEGGAWSFQSDEGAPPY